MSFNDVVGLSFMSSSNSFREILGQGMSPFPGYISGHKRPNTFWGRAQTYPVLHAKNHYFEYIYIPIYSIYVPRS